MVDGMFFRDWYNHIPLFCIRGTPHRSSKCEGVSRGVVLIMYSGTLPYDRVPDLVMIDSSSMFTLPRVFRHQV